MRITFVLENTQLWGGVKYVLCLARELSRRAHEVHIVSRTDAPDWFLSRDLHFHRVEDLNPEKFPAAEAGIGTYWTTIRPVHEARSFQKAFHLCQGYEGDFPPFEEIRDEIEAVYRLPLPKLVLSDRWEEALRSRFDAPVHQVGQFVDLDTFHPVNQVLPLSEPVRVCLVGPYEITFKGIPFILHALGPHKERLKLKILHVSQTPCTKEEKELNITDTYFHLLLPEEIKRLYRSCHFLIHAPASWEGFPFPPLEAAVCGCLPLVSDIPSFQSLPRELPRFEPRNEEALTTLLERLIRDPKERAASWTKIRDFAGEMTVRNVADRFLQALHAPEGKTT